MSAPAEKRVLAIDPFNKGFGYAVLEGPECLIDWEVKEPKTNANELALRAIEKLIDHYQPDALVIEDYASADSRRCLRVQRLLRSIQTLGSRRKIPVRNSSRAKVKKAFSQYGASTKQQIAAAIAERFPELKPRLPPVRKAWMSEHKAMAIFDACAFALTFFYVENKKKRVP